jgi:murein L,D-transpeptidase YcbB/YkuD
MRGQRASRSSLLLIVSIIAALASGRVAAEDRSTAEPGAGDHAAVDRTAALQPAADAESAERFVPFANPAPSPAAIFRRAAAALDAEPASPLLTPFADDAALAGGAGRWVSPPEITGSLPEKFAPSAVAVATVLAAVAPDETQDPLGLSKAPATATPVAPESVPPTTPSGQEAPGSSGTPAAAPTAGPGLAEPLHNALDTLAAAEVKGRDAAEIRRLRAAIASFYAARNYAPLWVADGKPNAAATSVMERLAHASDDGLTIDDLPVPDFEAGGDAELLATAELDLTQRVVVYARQASGSRVDPHQITLLIGAKPSVAEPADILNLVAAAGDKAGNVLEDFNPPQLGYRALRDKLAEARRAAKPAAAATPIPDGPTLKIGMSDPRVPLIRARFGLDTEPGAASDDLLYDTRVAAAVAEFQKASGLPPSGILTARTVAALAGDPPSRLDERLRANMEMWRWMPRDLGKDRVDVNIPNFEVTVFRDDQPIWRSKVVVGKPQTPTPVFSNVMRFLIVNPYWNVPPSIIRKEMLPHLAQDPSYLARMGYEVFTRHGQLVVRQPPGERNALGRIKFMFPNDYSVYLHDTPSRSLFGQAKRAFSHGCVRVDEPFNFAQAVLGGADWPIPRIKRLIGGAERYVNLPEPLPIHIEYFTAFVDADAHLQLRDDVYGYARKVEAALGLAN